MYLRAVIDKFLNSLELPGTLYVKGKYRYLNDATIFPACNMHFLKVAHGVNLQDAFFNLWDEIVLEEGVVLGHQVMFLTGRHAVNEEGVEKQASSSGKIVVKKKAWIGSRAIVLGGNEIGAGAIVGAGSVVTHSIPGHEFWAGNPARFIRQLNSKEISA